MKPAYYNEIDPFAAQTLRNLITAGHIAPGDVDERSIEDVHPSDLKPYAQCHFFAGVGVWSYALRRAGWADDRPVWTGSCPCQPFSQAGEGAGFDDQRHLWPHFFHLIEQRRPPKIFGEQVASRDADPWIDLVQDDLEGLGYGVGAVPFPSAGVGAPHIRDRLYWMAYANGTRHISSALARVHRRQEGPGPRDGEPKRHGANGGLADTNSSPGRQGSENLRGWAAGSNAESWAGLGGVSLPDGMADHHQHGCTEVPIDQGHDAEHHLEPCGQLGNVGNAECKGLALGQRIARIPSGASGADAEKAIERAGIHPPARPGPTNGHWSAADWLLCRDGKWRPVEPSTFPLAHGAPARVGRLRAYGNAINAEAARVFIEAAMSCMP